jgi:F-box protein 9
MRTPERTSRELADDLADISLQEQPGDAAAAAAAAAAVADEELERFRSEWRREVKSRLPPTASAAGPIKPSDSLAAAPSAAGPSHVDGPKGKAVDRGPIRKQDPTNPILFPPRSTDPTSPPQRSTQSLSPVTSPIRTSRPLHAERADAGTSRSPDRLKTFGRLHSGRRGGDAVTIYARAVEAEQGGQLNDALKLYRQAFKLDGEITIPPPTPSSRHRAKAASITSER